MKVYRFLFYSATALTTPNDCNCTQRPLNKAGDLHRPLLCPRKANCLHCQWLKDSWELALFCCCVQFIFIFSVYPALAGQYFKVNLRHALYLLLLEAGGQIRAPAGLDKSGVDEGGLLRSSGQILPPTRPLQDLLCASSFKGPALAALHFRPVTLCLSSQGLVLFFKGQPALC